MGILIWTFGHVTLPVIEKNFKLWNSLEMFILSKVGLNKINPFTLSQITYGFQKSNHGSREFWKKISENYINS